MQNIEIYSTYNKRKSIVTERFIRTLKNKIYKTWLKYQKCVYWQIRWSTEWIQQYISQNN